MYLVIVIYILVTLVHIIFDHCIIILYKLILLFKFIDNACSSGLRPPFQGLYLTAYSFYHW